jgi:hypothetical protein
MRFIGSYRISETRLGYSSDQPTLQISPLFRCKRVRDRYKIYNKINSFYLYPIYSSHHYLVNPQIHLNTNTNSLFPLPIKLAGRLPPSDAVTEISRNSKRNRIHKIISMIIRSSVIRPDLSNNIIRIRRTPINAHQDGFHSLKPGQPPLGHTPSNAIQPRILTYITPSSHKGPYQDANCPRAHDQYTL